MTGSPITRSTDTVTVDTGTSGTRRSTSLLVPPSRLIAALVTGVVLSLAVACGSDDAASDLSPAAQEGSRLFTSRGCGGCHGSDGTGGIGPELVGMAGTERELEDGSVVVADEEYIRRSITDPDADIVTGYRVRMPANQLGGSDVDALVAYLLELEASP